MNRNQKIPAAQYLRESLSFVAAVFWDFSRWYWIMYCNIGSIWRLQPKNLAWSHEKEKVGSWKIMFLLKFQGPLVFGSAPEDYLAKASAIAEKAKINLSKQPGSNAICIVKLTWTQTTIQHYTVIQHYTTIYTACKRDLPYFYILLGCAKTFGEHGFGSDKSYRWPALKCTMHGLRSCAYSLVFKHEAKKSFSTSVGHHQLLNIIFII